MKTKKDEKKSEIVSMDKQFLGNVHNSIINIGVPDLSASERKLLIAVIIMAEDRGTNVLRLKPSQVGKMAGYKPRSTSRIVDTVMKSYSKFLLRWKNEENNSRGIESIFERFTYDGEKNELVLEVKRLFLDLFNNLTDNGNYTRLLNEYTSINSRYALIAYEHMQQYRLTGVWRIELAEFKKLMGLPKKMEAYQVNQKVINIIKEELSNIYDDFKAVPVYRRGKIVEYVFIIPPQGKSKHDKELREKLLEEFKDDCEACAKKDDETYHTCAFYKGNEPLLLTVTASPYERYKKLLPKFPELEETTMVGVMSGTKEQAQNFANKALSIKMPKYNSRTPGKWDETILKDVKTERMSLDEFFEKYVNKKHVVLKKNKVEDAYMRWFDDEKTATEEINRREQWLAEHDETVGKAEE